MTQMKLNVKTMHPLIGFFVILFCSLIFLIGWPLYFFETKLADLRGVKR